MKEILTADQMRRSDQRMIQKMQVPSLVLVRVVIQNFLKKPVISTVFKADE